MLAPLSLYAFQNKKQSASLEPLMHKQRSAMAEKLQTYVSQPSEDMAGWEVAKFCDELSNYVPIKGEFYLTEELAKERASELNKTVEEH